MSEETNEEVAAEGKVTGRPWHLWLIGILSVLWGSMGCLDFTMTQTRNMAYLEAGGFTPEQIEFFVSFPLWANPLWAVAVCSPDATPPRCLPAFQLHDDAYVARTPHMP